MDDVMLTDLRDLLDALGLFSGARPQSPHEVMREAIAEAARLRSRVAELEKATAYHYRTEDIIAENARLRRYEDGWCMGCGKPFEESVQEATLSQEPSPAPAPEGSEGR